MLLCTKRTLVAALKVSRVGRDRFVYKPFRPPVTWNALQELNIEKRYTDSGEPTLDGTLDLIAYQLFRDGLLPPSNVSGAIIPRINDDSLTPLAKRRLQKERDSAVAFMKKNGVDLRRSIKETALVIGCDEAGRGPLAGPVVGAAVCRVPVSSFNNEFEQLYEANEQFQIFDSKNLSETYRDMVFAMITGHVDFFDISAKKKFTVHHCGEDAQPDDSNAPKRIPSHQKLANIPFKKLLSNQKPYLVSYHGWNRAGNYLYLWSIGIANHAYIDKFNIYNASMHAMHRCALSIWDMLNDTRFSQEAAPRPKSCSISQYLFTRFCAAANHDDEKKYKVPLHLELTKGASDFFDFEPIQPPVVLVDGHAVPEASYAVFTDLSIGGDVQPIIEGDGRSLSIAAASCLAKVTRDELMNYLEHLYPGYDLGENKGYPVERHIKKVMAKGISPIHRRTFRPCKLAIEKFEKKKSKGKQN
ncbi:ribonuclease HII [Angomonas deanei]|uniref:Ribonuclease n=1 Tax=Angomonas deanei TaxID=59799 RepID=S9X5K2_9TRYP|nr:ribonuclease HII [Angomonas deanei]EPY43815.1 ribonuclease HII [Angomonas deanei]CAD2214110.1 Ribonuclease HII, putative [Angomonas deanei]|eukprot:EPY34030.1 ribonuclease HII [Angomonas deanei]